MSITLHQLIRDAFQNQTTDVFIVEGEPARIRIESDVVQLHPVPIPRSALEEFWVSCGVDPKEHKEADVSYQIPNGCRVRVNLYHSLGRLAAVMRPIRSFIPPMADLGLPAELLQGWMQKRSGLILVTGPTGAGKSTTVASCLEWLNQNFARHIVTLEDPIEFLFTNGRSLFSQREMRQDSVSFSAALRSALRQSPDVLFLGEIRDLETAITALHSAATGHLVISTLHSSSIVETLDRFSHLLSDHVSGASTLLASQLIGVLSQQLLPRLGGGLFPALEYMQNEAATRRWIQANQLTEVQDYIAKANDPFNCSFLSYLVASVKQGYLSVDVAREACSRPQDFDRAMRGISN